jgi:UPF0755 protein
MLDTLPRRVERHRRTRRTGLIVLLVLVLLLVSIVAAGGLYWKWATGASGPQAKVTVVIPHGASGQEVADLLKARGVIRSSFAFRLLARFRGFHGGYQAGQYANLTTNMTISQVLAALKQGPVVLPSLSVLFPPGWRITQDGVQVQGKLHIPAKSFDQLASSGHYSLPGYLPAGTRTVEGFLFPDTYDFFASASAGDVITKLLAQFKKEADAQNWSRLHALGVTPYQAVIVASLVEREARYADERPKVAAVIYNRLKMGMPLEVDATLQYAKGNWAPITQQDKSLNSPFNSYLHTGLPPSPIANPGLASLQAALNPANVNYLYYAVTDCKGHSSFTASYQQFVQFLVNRPHC